MIPRVFGVDYQFLGCGDVFTQGLAHAAESLGVPYAHADWNAPDLPQKVRAFAPDLLFIVHGRKFCQRWGKAFRAAVNGGAGYRSAIWLLDEPYEVDDTSAFSPLFDHVFVNDPSTLDRHAHASYLPVCYDPVVHTPSPSPRRYPVGFVGGGSNARDAYLGALERRGLLSYVVGGSWADPRIQARSLATNLAPAATVALYHDTQIVPNIFRDRHHFNARGTAATSLNPRVYEATACGALVVSEWRPEVDKIVPELPTFSAADGCVELVADLLAHPDRAEAIRVQCAARLKDATYAARLQTVLTTCGLPLPVAAEVTA